MSGSIAGQDIETLRVVHVGAGADYLHPLRDEVLMWRIDGLHGPMGDYTPFDGNTPELLARSVFRLVLSVLDRLSEL